MTHVWFIACFAACCFTCFTPKVVHGFKGGDVVHGRKRFKHQQELYMMESKMNMYVIICWLFHLGLTFLICMHG